MIKDIFIDLDKKYITYLAPVGLEPTQENSELVECSISRTKNTVVFSKDGYQDMAIVPEYFDWLVYTGYIKII